MPQRRKQVWSLTLHRQFRAIARTELESPGRSQEAVDLEEALLNMLNGDWPIGKSKVFSTSVAVTSAVGEVALSFVLAGL